jgi:adenylate kinase
MILMMGLAGSGKGTQGKMLADEHNLHLISMGDVLRMHATGKQRERMLAGELLDDGEIIHLVDKVLNTLENDANHALLDGFPRTIPQAKWLLEQVKAGRFSMDHIFHLVATRDALKKRLLHRGRLDDTEKVIEERFNEYERQTAPLLKWLEDSGCHVTNVDAERSVEEINKELRGHLNS